MEFLEITDMVKKITFQAMDANGSQISHPVNNMFLLLSENHGLIRTINFKVFPDLYENIWYDQCHEYELSGIEGNEAGIQNLTTEKIFDINIGDEFHTERYLNNWPYSSFAHELMIYTVISKEVSPGGDTLNYFVSRCGKEGEIVMNEIKYHLYNDSIELTHIPYLFSYIDTIPERIIVEDYGDYWEYSYNIQQNLYNSEKSLKWNWYGFHSMAPHDCIEEIITDQKNPGIDYFYFIEGLGGPYWDFDFYWANYHKVLYFKTTNEEWGEPLNCDSLMVNIKNPFVQNQKIFFSPNPMSEKSILTFSNPNHENCTLILYNIYGNQVKELTTSGNKIIIKKENLTGGMYLYCLSIENRIVHSGKLMVH